MALHDTVTSPRIVSIQRELEAGNAQALESFWQDLMVQGTPLVEALPEDETHVLVTFLWKDIGDTQHVMIFNGSDSWSNPAENQMLRLLHTNLWYKTYKLRSDMRNLYFLSPNGPLDFSAEDWSKRVVETFRPDPFNPQQFGQTYIGSVLELPTAPPQPWIIPRSEVPKGLLEEHPFSSTLLNNERRVWVYTPPGYHAEKKRYPLLILLDGEEYTTLIPTPTILDNLLYEHQIPPCVAVLVETCGSTRYQELGCELPFVHCLTQELLPWVRQQYAVTTDRAQVTIGGLSASGLAAAFAGLKASEYFGNILSQSGSFGWGPRFLASALADESDAEWLIRQFANTHRLPLRWYLEVGMLERTQNPLTDQVLTNRHLRDVLQAKGYEVHYAEFNGGHTYLCWRGSLANGLLTLLSNDTGAASL